MIVCISTLSFPKTEPSLYNVNLKADNFAWDIHLPSTKNTFNGTDKMIDLSKSIRLNGMDYSTLHFGEPLLGNGDNMSYGLLQLYFFQRCSWKKLAAPMAVVPGNILGYKRSI